jgi:ATP-dependent Clp protease adapter protein ClpS
MIICRENPHVKLTDPEKFQGPDEIYRVTIIDNNYNTYDQVINICMEALNITYHDALHIALAVDNNGYAEVMEGPFDEASRVADIIRRIGITVRVDKRKNH